VATSLYSLCVPGYLQTLTAVEGFLEKGRQHGQSAGLDLQSLVDARLAHDMLPLRFQIVSVAHHSLGTVRALESGAFGPPTDSALDYAGLQKLVAETRAALAGVSAADVDRQAGRDVVFTLGQMKLPFTAEDFVLSFSLPNFYFHAATAYDVLRMKGVPLGKADFLGPMRMKR
jgi:hypothetical protein